MHVEMVDTPRGVPLACRACCPSRASSKCTTARADGCMAKRGCIENARTAVRDAVKKYEPLFVVYL